MRENANLEKNLEGEDNDFRLKHFIYLDKDKVHSYSSQLLEGIVQLKRLTENEGERITKASNEEEYTEKIQEEGKEGEGNLGPKTLAWGLSAKSTDKTIYKKGTKRGIDTESSELLYSSTEDVIEHDYGYLKLEEILIEREILQEITDIKQLEKYSSLVKITGICRFVDWDSIIEIFSNSSTVDLLIQNNLDNLNLNANKKNQEKRKIEKNIKIGMAAIKAFSLGSVTVNTRLGNSNLIGSINPGYLRIAREQLRSAYIMPGDVKMTMVGFIPNKEIEKISFPGIGGMLDMTAAWKEWAGEIDAVIEPIAIYTEIK